MDDWVDGKGFLIHKLDKDLLKQNISTDQEGFFPTNEDGTTIELEGREDYGLWLTKINAVGLINLSERSVKKLLFTLQNATNSSFELTDYGDTQGGGGRRRRKRRSRVRRTRVKRTRVKRTRRKTKRRRTKRRNRY